MSAIRRVLTTATLTVLLAAAGAQAAGAAGKVHIRGTAYEFNNVKVKLAGAKIKVDEIPSAEATVKADGTYDLTVPAKATVTPYIVLTGYRTIYLQTFTINGEDLEHVNFQMPSEPIAVALAQILPVPVDADNVPLKCVIVSTFSTRNVRGLDVSFDDFTGYGAHGVAGATASVTPAARQPIYFNEKVLPDPAQKLSSKDGGVVWTELPAAVYTVKATAPGTKFASFKATCKDGRIINANPSWGLHELGLKNTTVAKPRWNGKTLDALTLTKLPKGATLTLGSISKRVTSTTFNAATLLKSSARTLRRGKTLELSVTAPGYDGLVLRWKLNARGKPAQQKLCLPLGNILPRASC